MNEGAEMAARPAEFDIDYPNVEEGTDVGPHSVVRRYQADVVVVGSGAGGATAAARLREAGFDVLILEEGALHRTQSFNTDPISSAQKLYRDAGTSPIMGNPQILFAEGRCVGGSTVLNGGMCWRTPEHVLEHWSRELGIEAASPREMEAYFEEAEKILNVEFQNEDTLGRNDRLFVDGASRLGWEIRDNPRNMDRCVGLNNCAYGCPTGAKQSMLVTEIPRALAMGARLVTHARVWRVDSRRQDVVGVRGRFVDEAGRRYGRFEVTAKLVVLAAGARHTPAILKRSGFGDPNIGRGLHTHPNAKVVGIFDERIDPWMGTHQAHQIHQFAEDGIVMGYAAVPPGLLATGIPGLGDEHGERMLDFNRMLTAACLVEDSGEGRVRMGLDGEPWMQFKIADADLDKIHLGVGMLARLMFAAGAKEVLLPFGDLPTLSDPGELGRIERHSRASRDIELMTVHIMSSCRMSSSPDAGATDSFARVRGVRGLVVADASCIPSSIGVNPMETIVALALRNADRWAEDLRRGASRRASG